MAQKGAYKEVPDVRELEEYERKIKENENRINELRQHQEEGCPVCSGKASKIDIAPNTG